MVFLVYFSDLEVVVTTPQKYIPLKNSRQKFSF